jgi:hypothetical protein
LIIATITTRRLSLAPLQAGDAEEMAGVLGDAADIVVVNFHPDHHASAAVAARAGLTPTGKYVDGEQVWRIP